jgi:hypothetical protein
MDITVDANLSHLFNCPLAIATANSTYMDTDTTTMVRPRVNLARRPPVGTTIVVHGGTYFNRTGIVSAWLPIMVRVLLDPNTSIPLNQREHKSVNLHSYQFHQIFPHQIIPNAPETSSDSSDSEQQPSLNSNASAMASEQVEMEHIVSLAVLCIQRHSLGVQTGHILFSGLLTNLLNHCSKYNRGRMVLQTSLAYTSHF